MKTKLLFISMLALCLTASAQFKVTKGPGLENDPDNKMNRMIVGDDNSFYCYRIKTKGKGTSFFVEKYTKTSLKPDFSKEISLEDNTTIIEDVKFAMGKVYIFRRQYDKEANEMSLFYQTVSSSGEVSQKLEKLTTVSADHYEFVDFDFTLNPSRTKFLLKACHKATKDEQYKTDFVMYDAATMKQLWTKQVEQKLFTSSTAIITMLFNTVKNYNNAEFIGLSLDDEDNIYYAYTYLAKNSTDKEKHFKLAAGLLPAKETVVKMVELAFDDDYAVGDVQFSKNASELVVGGFLKDVIERKGRDLVKVGIFSFTINLASAAITSKAVKMFDDKLLTALESNPKRAQYFKYKMDYVLPIGKDIYFVGEQYGEQAVKNNNSYGAGIGGSSTTWMYEYMDVIIAKLNAKGEFEWIKNTPLRINTTMTQQHVFKEYIAVASDKKIYILNDEHPKNMELAKSSNFDPKDLKTVVGIHGTNFVCSAINVATGAMEHNLIFENDTYCFAPIQEKNIQFVPPSDTEIFVPGKNKEIYIYTEDRGKDQFCKITFE